LSFAVITTICTILAGGLWLHYRLAVVGPYAHKTNRPQSPGLRVGSSTSVQRGNLKLFLDDGSTVDFLGTMELSQSGRESADASDWPLDRSRSLQQSVG
jgi:hypothetical protein